MLLGVGCEVSAVRYEVSAVRCEEEQNNNLNNFQLTDSIS
jgi:hypothetical protein